ncbi:thioredoxin [Idiomarina piscisalsi]|uniref:Thioredoxin n=1 Tax=Idiomarina piscisalsi TaxID=1096243 RepID=A0ABM6LSI4_9GAMM|nr:DUF6436 domain-containing protein [Idiomarina piscisalsi]ASG65526.1 thioredoxin [Idiomarina piscisalsi]
MSNKLLNKGRPQWVVVTVFLWFAIALWGLSYLLEQRLVWFDSEGQLIEMSDSGDLGRSLKLALKNSGFHVEGSIFHISSQGCRCNWRSAGHIGKVKRQVTEFGGENYSIDVDQVVELKRFVPATPAVIMFNNSSELIYLGPYADGAFCTTNSSFVEELIPLVLMEGEAPAWINAVAKGCYCEV